MSYPVPLAVESLWRAVMQEAGWQCQCTGGCGRTHAKEQDGRCSQRHRDTCRLVASAPAPTGNPHVDLRAEPIAYCPNCYDGHRRLHVRAQKTIPVPAEPLFDVPAP